MKTEGGRVRKGSHKHTDHGPRHPSVRSQESPFPIFQERQNAEEATRVCYDFGYLKDKSLGCAENLLPAC